MKPQNNFVHAIGERNNNITFSIVHVLVNPFYSKTKLHYLKHCYSYCRTLWFLCVIMTLGLKIHCWKDVFGTLGNGHKIDLTNVKHLLLFRPTNQNVVSSSLLLLKKIFMCNENWHWGARLNKALMQIALSTPGAQPEVVYILVSNESQYFSNSLNSDILV